MTATQSEIFEHMRVYINKRAAGIRVQTELGTGVKITKREAIKMLDVLERRGIVPTLNCIEVTPNTMRYLITIEKSTEGGGVFVDR